MKIVDILKDDSFIDSQIVAGHAGLNNEVSSVMILEASDIENWGAKHQLILSSYFALVDLDQEGLEAFYKKMKDIGISGLIIKPKRLIKDVPQQLIQLSNKYSIPLLLIDPRIKYEHIVMAVLQPIINENTSILNSYYEYRRMLSQLSLKNYSIKEILEHFKSFLHTDTQLELLGEKFCVTTLSNTTNYSQAAIRTIDKSKYVEHDYLVRTLNHPNKSSQDILSVYIPNIENKPYLFSVFKNPSYISQKEYMLIENAVEFLQNQLLIEHALKKDQFLLKNNHMLDLLFNPNLSSDEKNRILNHLTINQFDHYLCVMVSLISEKCNREHQMEKLIAVAKQIWPHVAFLKKNQEIIFLYNLPENKLIGETEFKELIDSNCIIHVAISEPLTTDFHKSVVSLEKLIKFMSIIYPQSAILDYRTLGFYKLFLNVQSMDELMEFVPQNVINVVNNKPDLAETLETFLDYSQNFVKTGELLYIHPKTVRYRIERLTEMLNLDLNDPTQLLTTHVALKVCSYAKNSN